MKKLEEERPNLSYEKKPLEVTKLLIGGVYGLEDNTAKAIWDGFISTILNYTDTPSSSFKAGIILGGPPGTGKTYLMRVVGGELKTPLIVLTGEKRGTPEDIMGVFRHLQLRRTVTLEEALGKAFDKSKETVKEHLLFLAEKKGIDATAMKGYVENILNVLDRWKGERVEIPLGDSKKKLTISRLTLSLSPISSITTSDGKAAEELLNELIDALQGVEGPISLESVEWERILAKSFYGALSIPPFLMVVDEIDSMGNREMMTNPPLNTLLEAMEGVNNFNSYGIFLLGATNKPAWLDEALNRRAIIIIIGYPSREGRERIIDVVVKRYGGELEVDKEAKDFLSSIPNLSGSTIKDIIEYLYKKKKEAFQFASVKLRSVGISLGKLQSITVLPQDVFALVGNLLISRVSTSQVEEALAEKVAKELSALGMAFKGYSYLLHARRKEIAQLAEEKKDGRLKNLLDTLRARSKAQLEDRVPYIVEALQEVEEGEGREELIKNIGIVYVLYKIAEQAVMDERPPIFLVNRRLFHTLSEHTRLPDVELLPALMASYLTTSQEFKPVVELSLAELINPFVGQTAQRIRSISERLATINPSILFVRGGEAYIGVRSYDASAEVESIWHAIKNAYAKGHTIFILVDPLHSRLEEEIINYYKSNFSGLPLVELPSQGYGGGIVVEKSSKAKDGRGGEDSKGEGSDVNGPSLSSILVKEVIWDDKKKAFIKLYKGGNFVILRDGDVIAKHLSVFLQNITPEDTSGGVLDDYM